MTLRIEKDSDGRRAVIRLSGRLRSEYLEELKEQLRGERGQITIDLDGVTLVDVEAVRFLNQCAADGVEVVHGSLFIREWMAREQNRKQ